MGGERQHEINTFNLDNENTRLKVQLLEKEQDIAALINITRGILGILGLIDERTGKVKEEYLSGEENVLEPILASIPEIMGLLTQVKLPIIGKRAEEKLEKKFAFVKQIVPIIEKYKDQL